MVTAKLQGSSFKTGGAHRWDGCPPLAAIVLQWLRFVFNCLGSIRRLGRTVESSFYTGNRSQCRPRIQRVKNYPVNSVANAGIRRCRRASTARFRARWTLCANRDCASEAESNYGKYSAGCKRPKSSTLRGRGGRPDCYLSCRFSPTVKPLRGSSPVCWKPVSARRVDRSLRWPGRMWLPSGAGVARNASRRRLRPMAVPVGNCHKSSTAVPVLPACRSSASLVPALSRCGYSKKEI